MQAGALEKTTQKKTQACNLDNLKRLSQEFQSALRQILAKLRLKGTRDTRTNQFMGLTLRVMDEDRQKMSDYWRTLGFQRLSLESSGAEVLALPLVESGGVSFPFACLRLVTAWELNPDKTRTWSREVYSMAGFFMHDVGAGASFLKIRQPHQMSDVACLTHGLDPVGLRYEVLQTTNEPNHRTRELLWNPQERLKYKQEIRQLVCQGQLDTSIVDSLLAQQPVIFGLVRMMIPESEKTLDFYKNVMGMKLLVVIPIPQFGFTLNFLGYSEEDPPNTEDLTAHENREWTWQRKLTTLELLCQTDTEFTYNGLQNWYESEERRREGFDSFQFLVENMENLEQLRRHPEFVATEERGVEVGVRQEVRKVGIIRDPNNLLLEVYSSRA